MPPRPPPPPPPPSLRKVAVLGTGLIGGSVLLAAREHLPGVRLSAWTRSPGEAAELDRRELADERAADPAGAARGADLVLLCTPVGAMDEVARALTPGLGPAAVVSDVGSVKAPVVAALSPRFVRPSPAAPGPSAPGPTPGKSPEPAALSWFVGAHPMAGREQGGLGSARADLFAGTVCLLTPDGARTAPAALERVRAFWAALGVARLPALSAAEHDEAVALVSHLPHLVAGALLQVAGAHPDALACAGPGLRDATRLAGGPVELWTEILSLNRRAVKKAILALNAVLDRLSAGLEPGGEAALAGFLHLAAHRRAEWLGTPPPPPLPSPPRPPDPAGVVG